MLQICNSVSSTSPAHTSARSLQASWGILVWPLPTSLHTCCTTAQHSTTRHGTTQYSQHNISPTLVLPPTLSNTCTASGILHTEQLRNMVLVPWQCWPGNNVGLLACLLTSPVFVVVVSSLEPAGFGNSHMRREAPALLLNEDVTPLRTKV